MQHFTNAFWRRPCPGSTGETLAISISFKFIATPADVLDKGTNPITGPSDVAVGNGGLGARASAPCKDISDVQMWVTVRVPIMPGLSIMGARSPMYCGWRTVSIVLQNRSYFVAQYSGVLLLVVQPLICLNYLKSITSLHVSGPCVYCLYAAKSFRVCRALDMHYPGTAALHVNICGCLKGDRLWPSNKHMA